MRRLDASLCQACRDAADRFLGCWLVGVVADRRHHGERQHHQGRYCQVNRHWNVLGVIAGSNEVLECSMRTRFLSPDPERFGPSPAVASCRHAMAARSEMTVDDALGREKTLRLVGRLEALHLPFSSPRWPV